MHDGLSQRGSGIDEKIDAAVRAGSDAAFQGAMRDAAPSDFSIE
jgi:hypothetical protein